MHRRARQAGKKLLAKVRGYGATVLGSQAPPGIDQRLAELEAAVLAGQRVERPWEIIRVQLGFVGRKVEIASVEREVIMARFTARRTTV